MKSSICRGLCLYLCGELRHFFSGKQLAVEASKKPSETLCSRLLERSGGENERGDFDGSEKLHNSYEPWKSCHSLTRKMSTSRQSEDKLLP